MTMTMTIMSIMMMMMMMMVVVMTVSIVNTACIPNSRRPAYITEAPLWVCGFKLIHLTVLVTRFFKCTLNEPCHNSSVQKGTCQSHTIDEK